jgi:hypothetical protein
LLEFKSCFLETEEVMVLNFGEFDPFELSIITTFEFVYTFIAVYIARFICSGLLRPGLASFRVSFKMSSCVGTRSKTGWSFAETKLSQLASMSWFYCAFFEVGIIGKALILL